MRIAAVGKTLYYDAVPVGRAGLVTLPQRPSLERAMTDHGIPVVIVNRGDYGRAPHVPQDLFITGDNLMSVKARLLLSLAIDKLGMLTPYADPAHPTGAEQARMAQELERYQEIFDTH